ncbi:hypothetical protein I7I48_05447 [Histoplasma ohiense]|nr:hypothetical protein I7I48_05447 [Histoplasma ohiense (nom. inval.)]
MVTDGDCFNSNKSEQDTFSAFPPPRGLKGPGIQHIQILGQKYAPLVKINSAYKHLTEFG